MMMGVDQSRQDNVAGSVYYFRAFRGFYILDRKSVVEGNSVDIGGRRLI